MSNRSQATLFGSGALRVLAICIVLWLTFIAPFASIFALLFGNPFYAWWFNSLVLLPAPILLLIGVFRSKSATFRWSVFQYLGVSAVCFSASLLGIVLSFFIPFTLAGKVALVACLIFCIWGIYSAHRIHVVNLSISSEKIKNALRLVQISDVHVGSRRAEYLEKVMRLVNEQKPDLLVITGDLVDENVTTTDLASLSGLDYPVFYSSGNHERYVDYKSVLDAIGAQGVTILGDTTTICQGLRIIGIEDRQHLAEAAQALARVDVNATDSTQPFSVLLYHQPDLWDAAKQRGIDLTLSGHTHKGQIWPFGLLVRFRYRYVAGLFKEATSHLFVSQGTGTWGPIMRLGTRCEITVIELTA